MKTEPDTSRMNTNARAQSAASAGDCGGCGGALAVLRRRVRLIPSLSHLRQTRPGAVQLADSLYAARWSTCRGGGRVARGLAERRAVRAPRYRRGQFDCGWPTDSDGGARRRLAAADRTARASATAPGPRHPAPAPPSAPGPAVGAGGVSGEAPTPPSGRPTRPGPCPQRPGSGPSAARQTAQTAQMCPV